MGNKHVYLEYDVMDNENQWIRSFNHRDGFGSTQYITRCGRLWESMQTRCYNELYLSKFPTYSGCTNAFSSFQSLLSGQGERSGTWQQINTVNFGVLIKTFL